METIIIKNIERKGDTGMVVVTYNGNRQATLNTKWQEQEVDYLEKDVGIGGEVSVEITPKGQYTNMTKVDMSSGKKNTAYTESEKIVDTPTQAKMSEKDKSIVAQVCIKGAVELVKEHFGKDDFQSAEDVGKVLCEMSAELAGAYKATLGRLE